LDEFEKDQIAVSDVPQEAQHYYSSRKKPTIIIPKTQQPAKKKPHVD
jgi:hypothetical protein